MAAKKTAKNKKPATPKYPVAVVISDLHMSLKFLEPASIALKAAKDKAKELDVPLICAGDFHDTKAIHRSECIRAARDILNGNHRTILLVGNHDRENEKSPDHALDCFSDLADIINVPMRYLGDLHFIPYCHDKDTFLAALAEIPNDAQLIVHQGISGARMGEYVADRSQVDPSVFDRFTKPVYSGHYHEKQTVGNFTYFGTPFTTSFSEANDGPKGFHILYSDGSIELIPLAIRKHVIVTSIPDELMSVVGPYPPDTLLWVKVEGTAEDLAALKKADVGMRLLGHSNFKLDKIKTDDAEIEDKKTAKTQSFEEIMTDMIANDFQLHVWKELNQ